MNKQINTAILWDIENVIPSTKGINYIQIIIDMIRDTGKISYAMAFGDWTRPNLKNIDKALAVNSFELLHVPRTGKDSSDKAMIAHGVELIFKYPDVQKFVLITGDADFRPLLQTLRKYGKETLVICNLDTASESLLELADDYKEYRDIIASDSSDDDSETLLNDNNLTKEQAFDLLEEALTIVIKNKKEPSLGFIKMTMKLLNSSFDEKLLNLSPFKKFANATVKAKPIRFSGDGTKLEFVAENKKELPPVFKRLLEILKNEEWIQFNEAGKKIKTKDFGYGQFKKLALDAEKRGLVEVKQENSTWSLRKKKNEINYCSC